MMKRSSQHSVVARTAVIAGLTLLGGCFGARHPATSSPLPSVVNAANEPAPPLKRERASPAAERRAEFEYRRVHAAAGQFITEQELARLADLPLIEALETHLRGFPGRREARESMSSDPLSQIEVYVNGLRAGAIDGLRPSELLGVEYYQATAAPVRYRRAFSSVPVLLLWLKP